MGAAAVALALVGAQLVLNARQEAAVARLVADPGVFPPLGDELVVVRTLTAAEQSGIWQSVQIGPARTAGVLVGDDGSQSFVGTDHRTGEALWSTPLLGPHAERAASRDHTFGGGCQADTAPGELATVAVCTVTDGYEFNGGAARVQGTSSRVVVLDTGDGHVITEWDVEEAAEVAVLPGLAVVGTCDGESGIDIVAHDVVTGDERWRYGQPADDGRADINTDGPMQRGSLFRAGDVVACFDGGTLTLLSATGSPVRASLKPAGGGQGLVLNKVTGSLAVATYAGTGARITTVLAADADPGLDLVVEGDLLIPIVDDGSVPGLVLTALGQVHAWDRRSGKQVWEADADVRPYADALVARGRVYLTTSSGVAALDGRTGEVVWRTELPSLEPGLFAMDGRDLLVSSSHVPGSLIALDALTGDEIRSIPYPKGVEGIVLLHGLLLGLSREGTTFLE